MFLDTTDSEIFVYMSERKSGDCGVDLHYIMLLKCVLNKIQQDATACRYLFTAKSLSSYIGCPSHPSSREHKTVTAVSGTYHII